MPVSCHFRGCKVPLSRIVSGAISSELPACTFIFLLTNWLVDHCGCAIVLTRSDISHILSYNVVSDVKFRRKLLILCFSSFLLLFPAQGALSDDAVWRLSVCLTSVMYIWSVGGVCGRPAGWCVLADRARLSGSWLTLSYLEKWPLKRWYSCVRVSV